MRSVALTRTSWLLLLALPTAGSLAPQRAAAEVPSQSSAAQSSAAQAAQSSSAQPSSAETSDARAEEVQGVEAQPEARPVIVADPLLEPLVPERRSISKWRQALQLVRANSADLGRARQNIVSARARARQALGLALPQLTAGAQLQHHLLTGQVLDTQGNVITLPNPQTIFGANASLSVPLLDLGTWYDASTAEAEADRAEKSAADTERLVLVGLADALLTVVTTERLAEVSRVSLSAALETLELTRRRASLGVGVTIDVLRAEQEVARSRSQVVDANESVHAARDALGLALGLSEAVGVEANLSLEALTGDARAACRRENDINSRADLLTALASESIGERNVGRVTRSFFPTITFGSTLSYNAFSRFSPNGDNTTWTIGAVLNYNLYDGGQRYALKRARAAELESLRLSRLDLSRRIEVEVRRAERAVHVAESALKIAGERRDSARAASKLAQFKFQSGSGSSFDLVDALKNTREAELDVAVKEFQLVRAEVAAFLALASCDI